MQKIIFGLGAAVLGLALTGAADAAGMPSRERGREIHRGPSSSRRHVESSRAYYLDHGVRFKGGYYFKGRDHNQWESRVWDSRHRRYQYWEPDLKCYFFYDDSRSGYFPVG